MALTRDQFDVIANSYNDRQLNNKIKLMFCDETHNPAGEIVPYYNSFNTSKKVQNQIKWKN